MDSGRKLLFSILLVLALTGIGTLGFMVLEGWNLIDSFYMTVTTLTTVGFGEVHELDTKGKLYTIILIVTGIGFFLYVIRSFVDFLIEGRIMVILGRKRLNKKIGSLKNHYIICGYGRIGRVLCRHLRNRIDQLVVIDNRPDFETIKREPGVIYISGDATEETTLVRAGIQKAKGLVAVLGTDADNVFLVLTARQLNPGLYITARAGYRGSKLKLKAAGADHVESPYEMGAASMAHRIIRPTVTSFLDLAFTYQRKDIQMEEIPVDDASKLNGVSLQDSGIRQNYNLIIIAIKKKDNSMRFNPSFETVLNGGDTVIAVGEEQNLKKLAAVLNLESIPRA